MVKELLLLYYGPAFWLFLSAYECWNGCNCFGLNIWIKLLMAEQIISYIKLIIWKSFKEESVFTVLVAACFFRPSSFKTGTLKATFPSDSASSSAFCSGSEAPHNIKFIFPQKCPRNVSAPFPTAVSRLNLCFTTGYLPKIFLKTPRWCPWFHFTLRFFSL